MPKIKKIKNSTRKSVTKKFKMGKVKLEMRRWFEASRKLEKVAEKSYGNLRNYMNGHEKTITTEEREYLVEHIRKYILHNISLILHQLC